MRGAHVGDLGAIARSGEEGDRAGGSRSRRDADGDDLELEHAGRHAPPRPSRPSCGRSARGRPATRSRGGPHRVGLGRADDAVRRVALALDVLERDLEPTRSRRRRRSDGSMMRAARSRSSSFAICFSSMRLLVLGVVVLGVLADVAELARLADAVGDLAARSVYSSSSSSCSFSYPSCVRMTSFSTMPPCCDPRDRVTRCAMQLSIGSRACAAAPRTRPLAEGYDPCERGQTAAVVDWAV